MSALDAEEGREFLGPSSLCLCASGSALCVSCVPSCGLKCDCPELALLWGRGGTAEKLGAGLCCVPPLGPGASLVSLHPFPSTQMAYSIFFYFPSPLCNGRDRSVFVSSGNPDCFSLACRSAAEVQKAENRYKRRISSGLTGSSSASAELFWVFPQAAESLRESSKVSYLMVGRIYLTFVLVFILGSVIACHGCACSQSIKMKWEG